MKGDSSLPRLSLGSYFLALYSHSTSFSAEEELAAVADEPRMTLVSVECLAIGC